jgi:hypothetical protein
MLIPKEVGQLLENIGSANHQEEPKVLLFEKSVTGEFSLYEVPFQDAIEAFTKKDSWGPIREKIIFLRIK